MLQRLVLADGAAELLAGLHVVHGHGVHGVHDADGLRTDGGDHLVLHPLHDGQGFGRVAQGLAGGVGQGDLCGAHTVLGGVAAALHAGAVGVHEEQADAMPGAVVAGGAGGDDQGIGAVAVQDEGLLPGQAPRRATVAGWGFHGASVDVVQAPAGLALGLGIGQHALAGGDARHQFGQLLGAGSVAQQAAAHDDGGKVGLDDQGAAEGFHDDAGLDRAAAEAAMLLGKGKAEQALVGELLPHHAIPAILVAAVAFAGVEGVEVRGHAVHAVLQQPLFLG